MRIVVNKHWRVYQDCRRAGYLSEPTADYSICSEVMLYLLYLFLEE